VPISEEALGNGVINPEELALLRRAFDAACVQAVADHDIIVLD
jgi:hypothetical protein